MGAKVGRLTKQPLSSPPLKPCHPKNINVNQCEFEGRRLIHYSADFGHVEILSFLIENGAEVNCKDKYGIR